MNRMLDNEEKEKSEGYSGSLKRDDSILVLISSHEKVKDGFDRF